MKLSKRNLEYVWHTVSLILLSGAFVPLWRKMALAGTDPSSGDPIQRIIIIGTYLGLVLLIYHPRNAWRVAQKGWMIWVLVGWALLSTYWSEAPDITLRRTISAALASLYGLLMAVRYRPGEFFRMFGVALVIVVVSSLIIILINPEWAIMTGRHEEAWRGVFIHKNTLGRIGALAIITFWLLSLEASHFAKFLWYSLIAIALFLTVNSNSASGLILVMTLPAGWLILKILTSFTSTFRLAVLFFLIIAFILLSAFLPNILDIVFTSIGRDPTLTGRIPLWNLLLSFVTERPLLGYGFSAFWLGEYGPSAIVWALTWEAPHAHNGYLDLQLELGLVGLVLGLIMITSLLLYSLHQLLHPPKDMKLILFTFFFSFFFIIANMSESVFLESDLTKSIYWILISYFTFTRASVQQPPINYVI